MSPIKTDTIHTETWTSTTKRGFCKTTQVLAEGDDNDPGFYIYERGIYRKNVNYIRNRNLIVDVQVDFKTGEIIHEPGVLGLWRRYKER